MPFEPHPEFRLNGNPFSKKDLSELAYSFIKEGKTFEAEIGDFLLHWVSKRAWINIHTSGSTGTAKEIALEKHRMINSARATGSFFNIKAGNTALHCLPTKYIAGKMMLVRAMVLGLKIDCIEPSSDPLVNCKGLYDFCAMVPLQLQNSLEKLNGIKTLIIGGAPISPALRQKALKIKCSIYETFGMTETISHIAVKSVNRPPDLNFKTLPNVTISKDSRDCLIITAPSISGQDIITNDIIKLISKTEFEWLGRYDNIINSGGIKLVPEVIESKLAALITHRFFITGIPDEKLGQKMVLMIEGEMNKARILKSIATISSLDKHEIPKDIYLVQKFMETGNGKILRKETAARVLS